MTDAGRLEIKNEIMNRIEVMETFTFSQLHSGLGDDAYRIADVTLQKLRKEGKISYYKSSRQFVWYKVKNND